jgi:hypothetical protein
MPTQSVSRTAAKSFPASPRTVESYRYSYRSAFSGLTREARSAGT